MKYIEVAKLMKKAAEPTIRSLPIDDVLGIDYPKYIRHAVGEKKKDPRISVPSQAEMLNTLVPFYDDAYAKHVSDSADTQRATLRFGDTVVDPWRRLFYTSKGWKQRPTGQTHPATGKPVYEWYDPKTSK